MARFESGTDDIVDAIEGLQFGPESWLYLSGLIFVAVLGSSLLTAVFEKLSARFFTRKDAARFDASDTLDKVETLRAAFQRYESEDRVVDRKRDLDLAKLSNAVFIAVAKTSDRKMMELARNYVKVGERFVLRDAIRQDEDDSFFGLLGYFTDFVRKNR